MEYISGNKITDGSACLYLNMTAGTAQVKTGTGQIYGCTINSHTSGTLALYDALSTATTKINNTITFASGERYINLGGVSFGTGLYAVVGGTADITLHYR